MKPDESLEVVQAVAPGVASSSEFEVGSARAVDPKRKAEFRTAIEASTARILSIAMTRGPVDPDPEAA